MFHPVLRSSIRNSIRIRSISHSYSLFFSSSSKSAKPSSSPPVSPSSVSSKNSPTFQPVRLSGLAEKLAKATQSAATKPAKSTAPLLSKVDDLARLQYSPARIQPKPVPVPAPQQADPPASDEEPKTEEEYYRSKFNELLIESDLTEEQFNELALELRHNREPNFLTPNLSDSYRQRITADYPLIEVKLSPISGRGLFARESVKAGTIIWEESPFVSIPIPLKSSNPKPTIAASRRLVQKVYHVRPELIDQTLHVNPLHDEIPKLSTTGNELFPFDQPRIPGKKINNSDLNIWTVEDLAAVARGKIAPSKVQQFLAENKFDMKSIESSAASAASSSSSAASSRSSESAASPPIDESRIDKLVKSKFSSIPQSRLKSRLRHDQDAEDELFNAPEAIDTILGSHLHDPNHCSNCMRSLKLPIWMINRSGNLSSPYDSPLEINSVRTKANSFIAEKLGRDGECFLHGGIKCTHNQCRAVFCSIQCQSESNEWHHTEHEIRDELIKYTESYEKIIAKGIRSPGNSELLDLLHLVYEVDKYPEHFYGLRELLFRSLCLLKSHYDSGKSIIDGQNPIKDFIQLSSHDEISHSEEFAMIFRRLFLKKFINIPNNNKNKNNNNTNTTGTNVSSNSSLIPIIFPDEFIEIKDENIKLPLKFEFWLSKRGFRQLLSAIGTNGFTPHIQSPRLLIGGFKLNPDTANCTTEEEIESIDKESLTKYIEKNNIIHPVAPTQANSSPLRVPTPYSRSALYYFQFNWPMKSNRRNIIPETSLAAPSLFRLASFMNHACEESLNILPSPPFPDRKVRFMAARDLNAGDELFWHYGESGTVSENYNARCACPKCKYSLALHIIDTLHEMNDEQNNNKKQYQEDEDEEDEEEGEEEAEEDNESNSKSSTPSSTYFQIPYQNKSAKTPSSTSSSSSSSIAAQSQSQSGGTLNKKIQELKNKRLQSMLQKPVQSVSNATKSSTGSSSSSIPNGIKKSGPPKGNIK